MAPRSLGTPLPSGLQSLSWLQPVMLSCLLATSLPPVLNLFHSDNSIDQFRHLLATRLSVTPGEVHQSSEHTFSTGTMFFTREIWKVPQVLMAQPQGLAGQHHRLPTRHFPITPPVLQSERNWSSAGESAGLLQI